jgi:L-asparagine oxygenase
MGVSVYDDIVIGFIPSTPATPYTESSPTLTANDSLIEFAMGLGYPVGYAQEQEGRIIQDIVPVHKTEYRQISTSSKVELALHTETAFHPYKPDYVLLLCVRSDPAAETTYANLDDILPKLDKDTIRVLMNPWFLTGIDESFRTRGEPDMEIPLSVLKESDTGWELTYDATVMSGVNNAARQALIALDEAINSSVQAIALKSAQLLVIDNRTTVHGRRPFSPRYDGRDRWLKRALVVKSLPPEHEYRNGVITTKFPR